MQIIPVIDLKNGIVVHAKQGDREHYAPTESQICKTADIFDVINAFSAQFNFETIYIADLDGITEQNWHSSLLAEVLQTYPNINFWLDAGYPVPENTLRQFANYWPVLGSESFTETTVDNILSFKKKFILSLDHNSAGEMGTKSLFQSPYYWPDNIIIMSLLHVGSQLGPDLDRLTYYCQHHPQYNFIAAGGVRNMKDLDALTNIGINRCLIASALHKGSITYEDIAALSAKKYPDQQGIFSTT